jgi:NADPH:quinone reductase-like Zn-dependent oxidoreductase
MRKMSSERTMMAIGQVSYGDATVLDPVQVSVPKLKPNDVLVRVEAFSVNPIDAKRRAGKRGDDVLSRPLVLGFDGAGVVEQLGTNVSNTLHRNLSSTTSSSSSSSLFVPQLNDNVFFCSDIRRSGCAAHYVAVDADVVARKPRSLNFADSAALPLTALTAYECLFEHPSPLVFDDDNLPPALSPSDNESDSDATKTSGKTLLVIGGGGGVGSMALQLAKFARYGAGGARFSRVLATASRPETEAWSRSMGATAIINHYKPLREQLDELGIGGVDFVVHSGDVAHTMAELALIMRPFGHVAIVSPPTKPLDTTGLAPRRVTLAFQWVFCRAYFDIDKPRHGRILATVADLVDRGLVKSTANNVLPFTSTPEAHRILDSGRTIGKIVLTTGTDSGSIHL